MASHSALPSYNPTTCATQYGQRPGAANTPYRGCVSKGFQVTGILHIIAGALCTVLGIAAIVLKARFSYLGLPIVFGLLLFTVTGILGAVYYAKPKNWCIIVAYLVMAILSAVFSFIMMIFFSIISAMEGDYYGSNYHCFPFGYEYCNSSNESRVAVDSILTIIFFLEIGCGITAASIGCYKSCRCCRTCCTMCSDEPAGNSNVVYYAANMGGQPMMAVPDNQFARPIYIAGGASGTHNQPGQFMYMSPSPQPQSYVPMPAGIPQNQMQSAPVLAQAQSVPLHQQPAPQGQLPGMAPQLRGPPPGQAGFVQVQGAGGQLQMVPAQAVYPQVMMIPGPQQPGPPQDQVQQATAPSKSAEAHAGEGDVAEEVCEERDVSSGQIFDGQFTEQASLI